MEINNFLSIENIVLTSTGLINLILFIVILLKENKKKNTYFFLGFVFSVLNWVIFVLIFRIIDIKKINLVTNFIYFFATLIPFFIILFVQTFPKRDLGFTIKQKILLTLFPIIFSIIVFIPGLVVKQVLIINQEYRSIIFGPLYYFYFFYIIIYFLIGIRLIIKRFQVLIGIEKNQIEIIFLSILISSVAGMTTNLIMPSFNNFTLFWVGPFFSGYMVLTIFYAMIKYSLFNIKLITAEITTLSTSLLISVKFLIEKNGFSKLIDGIILFILVISGVYVIKSIKKEVKLREKDDQLVNDMISLNKKLEKANMHLKELDQKKSEFISLATHQLRAPLTAMRGYYSMILDGTFGKIENPELEDALDKISRSTTDLTMIVEDYLNISRIEQGRMQYNFISIDLTDIVNEVIKEVMPTLNHAGLVLNFKYDQNQKYMVSVDKGKIKQVIFNIIDNSIKYTPKGSINISIEKTQNNKVLLSIKDTGVGIKPSVLPILFQKFTRAPDASDTNIIGTGLGLYVANQILKAHDGRAWAKSDGQNKGSEFYVELGLID